MTRSGVISLSEALRHIQAAAERLRPYARQTPTVYSYTFSEAAGCDVWLKLENLQRTGSFKLRGALNKVLLLSPEQRERGLIAASAGNHAQGVALAAKLVGAVATIVMPEPTAIIKIRRTQAYGANVVLKGENYDQAQRHAQSLAEASGLTLIHPFDDLDVILGQGTVGLEILEQVPMVETIVVPIGGGGLAAGIVLAVKALRKDVRVVGVQAEGAAAMVESLRGSKLVAIDAPSTIAEGIRVGRPGELCFNILREHLDETVLVGESELTEAMVQTLAKSKVVPEAAGVAAVAALTSNVLAAKGSFCAVVSGGNIDLHLLGRLIECGLAAQGFYHLATVRLRDAPGELHRVLGLLATSNCNVLDIQHYRAGWKVPVGFVDVEILLETRFDGQGAEIDELLRRAAGASPA